MLKNVRCPCWLTFTPSETDFNDNAVNPSQGLTRRVNDCIQVSLGILKARSVRGGQAKVFSKSLHQILMISRRK